jgi:hypothetical protein
MFDHTFRSSRKDIQLRDTARLSMGEKLASPLGGSAYLNGAKCLRGHRSQSAVVRALKVIEKHRHMAKFVRAAKEQEAAGAFDAKTVNFVKDFMVKYKMHNDPIGKHIVNAKQQAPRGLLAAYQTGRFNCNFGN